MPIQPVQPSQPFEASLGQGESGLVGTMEVAILDNDGNTVVGPVTTDITEETVGGQPTGVYTWNCPAAPAVAGQYVIVWSPDGTWDPETTSTPDELIVSTSGLFPPLPPAVDGGPELGPATAWTTPDQVALCCDLPEGTDLDSLEPFINEASQLLFLFSGRLFFGLGTKTGARPPCRYGCACGQVLSRGHIVGDWWGTQDACNPSRVLLSGYPVREITQVKIDGAVLAATEYGLLNWRWLVRKNDGVWPYCQNMSLDDTEDGTWSVSYTYGQNPPIVGQAASAELACELYKACNTDECSLPTGVTRIVRQGVVIERMAFAAWGLQGGIWKTGLPLVDAFLNAVARNGLQRRPTIWSPASHLQYPKRALI